jgi:hypothetical protein
MSIAAMDLNLPMLEHAQAKHGNLAGIAFG